MFKRSFIPRALNFINRRFVGPTLRFLFVKSGLFRKYRFLNTNAAAIGHLCLDVEAFVKEASINNFSFRGILLANRKIVANEVIGKLWSSNARIYVVNSPIACYLLNNLRMYEDTGFDCSDYSARHDMPAKLHQIRNDYGDCCIVINWLPDLYSNAKSLFARLFPHVDTRRLVVLHSRDSFFDVKNKNFNCFVHKYRNSNIRSYSEILKFLNNNKYYVIRIGEYSDEASDFDGFYLKIPRLPKFEVDLLNAYVASSCVLFLGSSSGALALATIWDRPIFLLNFLPYYCLRHHTPRSMAIPKLLSLNGRILTAKEIFQSGYYRFDIDNQFKEGGIEILSNSADECMDDFKEFFRAFVEEDEDLRMQLINSSQQEKYAKLSPPDCFDHHAAGLIPRHFFRRHGIV